jgi:hypothetical protein
MFEAPCDEAGHICCAAVGPRAVPLPRFKAPLRLLGASYRARQARSENPSHADLPPKPPAFYNALVAIFTLSLHLQPINLYIKLRCLLSRALSGRVPSEKRHRQYRFAAEPPNTHPIPHTAILLHQRGQGRRAPLLFVLIRPNRNFSVPSTHPIPLQVSFFTKQLYPTSNLACRTLSTPSTADGNTCWHKNSGLRAFFERSSRHFSMATQDISARGSEPQPVPKQEVMDDSQSHLDESKLRQFFIGSIDQGTTSTRFIIFDGLGEPVAQHQIEFNQKYPQSGSVFSTARVRKLFLTSPDGTSTTRKRSSIP